MAIYKPYPKYKNSNIPWLGEIPEHWMETKPKFIGFLFGGLSGKSGSDFSKDFVKGYKAYIPFTNIANNRIISLKNLHYVKIGENEKQNKVQKGDLFFLMSSENFEDIGKTALLNDEVEDVYLNSFCKGFRITDNNFDSSFINYLFNADVNRKQLIIQARGFTRINLKIGKVNDLQLFTPTDIEEQTAIARFLDYKLAKINRFIQKKKQLIKLLNEQKAAIINQAVTKGLDPNAKMKDSGIEWLGEIPEHWEWTYLRRFCQVYSGGTPSRDNLSYWENGTIPWLASGEVNKRFIYEADIFITEEGFNNSSAKWIPKGSLVIALAGQGKTKGMVATIENSMTGNQSLAAVIPNKKILDYVFLSYYIESKYKLIRGFVGDLRDGLNLSHIKSIPIPILPLDEQIKIANFIKNEHSVINTTISKIEKELALVEEYKTTLIAEAVTGKIDVRGYEVPEISEEETYEDLEDPDSYRDSMAAEDEEEYQTTEE